MYWNTKFDGTLKIGRFFSFISIFLRLHLLCENCIYRQSSGLHLQHKKLMKESEKYPLWNYQKAASFDAFGVNWPNVRFVKKFHGSWAVWYLSFRVRFFRISFFYSSLRHQKRWKIEWLPHPNSSLNRFMSTGFIFKAPAQHKQKIQFPSRTKWKKTRQFFVSIHSIRLCAIDCNGI